MLATLTLSNFRQHQALKLDFSLGLNAIRGANEKGKSGVLEGIAYALFGSRALRDSLENVVTWGKPVKDLKVELGATFHGRNLTFTRSKAGAEAIEGGRVIVTGQTEVSNFAADMLGGDLAICNKLLFANQGSLRGALEEGNKALSELIEGLADFDLFDRLLDLISHKLVVGSPEVMQARLQQIESTLAATPVPEKPAESNLPHAITLKIAQVEAEHATHEAPIKGYREWLAQVTPQLVARSQYLADLAAHELKLGSARKALEDLEAAPKFATTAIEPLREQLAAANLVDQAAKAYQSWQRRTMSASTFEGAREAFDLELADIVKAKNEAQTAITTKQGDVKVLNAKIITSLTCPTCGSTLKDAEDIKQRNQQYEAELAQLAADIAAAQDSYTALNNDEHQYKLIRTVDDERKTLAASLGDYVVVGLHEVPRVLSWVGPTSIKPMDIKAIDTAIRLAEASNTKAAMQAGAVQEAQKTLSTLESKVFVEVADVADYQARNEKVTEHFLAQSALTKELDTLRVDLRVAEAEVGKAAAEFEARMTSIEAMRATEKQLREDLSGLAFNNGLLKKVRGARPQVADKLWNTVLASVSQMFTQMRGEASTITKSKDGFACNGAPISSLSGSTLDLLALAIRCSLTRTFLPQANFLMLDEITAACDSDRSLTMLGFLAAAGFQQVLLVSHEDVVDQVADTLIQL